jgi:hypothetical protein
MAVFVGSGRSEFGGIPTIDGCEGYEDHCRDAAQGSDVDELARPTHLATLLSVTHTSFALASVGFREVRPSTLWISGWPEGKPVDLLAIHLMTG